MEWIDEVDDSRLFELVPHADPSSTFPPNSSRRRANAGQGNDASWRSQLSIGRH
jgi:hypothetical protein